MFVTDEWQAEVEPLYEAQLLDGIPHDRLALQWDVAIEMWMWEGWFEAPFDDVKGGSIERLVRISHVVPDDVELGFHLCYGDYDHEHFHEPDDAANLAEVANRISAAVRRLIQWLHLPVPIDRSVDAYFEPLRSSRCARRPSCTSVSCISATASRARARASIRLAVTSPTSAWLPSAVWAAVHRSAAARRMGSGGCCEPTPK